METHAFLVSEEPFFFYINVSSGFSYGEEYKAIQDGTKILYLIGYVDYSDKFGNKHRGGYARQYIYRTSDLQFVAQEGYNYDRNQQ